MRTIKNPKVFGKEKEIIEKAGGPSEVGRYFDISGWAVSLWVENGVPSERVPALIDLANSQAEDEKDYYIESDLRPDIFRN